MFQPRREVLKVKEGTLAETPLPLLLHALGTEEKTCTLEVKLRNLEKRVSFDEGVAVGCESNLLHETLGKYLVTKGKLNEAMYHTLLADSIASGKQLGGLLVEKQVVSAFELFKHLQANLAHKILDVFRWQDAKWKLLPEQEVVTPIRMNTAQLVFTGSAQMPPELVAQHFQVKETDRLALVPDVPSPQEELKLSPKDTRLLTLLKGRPTLGELAATPGFVREELLRRLYALCVLDMVDLADAVDRRPKKHVAPVMPAPAAAPAAPAAPVGVPFADDDEKTMNLLATEFFSYRAKDPFELLGLPLDVQAAPLQKAFLAKANALNPVRFKSADARGKAELLLAAYAKAFGVLADHESYLAYRKRRETLEAQKKSGGPKAHTAEQQFRIRTDLLDAQSQFDEGKKRFDAGNFKGAVEHFEYACDIEPRARSLAWLAFSRYRQSPQFYAPKALAELADACTREPGCEEAWAFRADLAMAFGRHDEADECYRKAVKLAPANARYTEALKKLAPLVKK